MYGGKGGKGACHNCGKQGHYIRDCPEMGKGKGKGKYGKGYSKGGGKYGKGYGINSIADSWDYNYYGNFDYTWPEPVWDATPAFCSLKTIEPSSAKPKPVAEGPRGLSASGKGGVLSVQQKPFAKGARALFAYGGSSTLEKEWKTQESKTTTTHKNIYDKATTIGNSKVDIKNSFSCLSQDDEEWPMPEAAQQMSRESNSRVDEGARALSTSLPSGGPKKMSLCGAFKGCCKGKETEDCHQSVGTDLRLIQNARHGANKSQAKKKAERKELNQIKTIEPDQINRVTQDGRWEEIELAVDSGATESVVPNTMPESIKTIEGPASKRGVMYEVASGHQIPNEGEKRFTAVTEEGQERNLTLQVCDVNQGLLSVAKMAQAGNRVVFDKAGSFVENKLTGERTWLQEKSGMFVMKLWVKRPF
jgi:hypothetical protein